MRVGETLGRYQIIEELARGAGAAVYKARDAERDQFVALKVFDADVSGDPARRDRWRREITLLSAIDHANIARLHEAGEEAGRLFFAMEYFAAGNLRSRIRRGLPLPEANALLRQIAGALSAAHAAGIVHGDLKPSNILVADDGHVVVSDFGAARRLGARAATDITTSVGGAGTPSYMSPEQMRDAPADARSDVYSFGVVAYEILTGEAPFTGANPVAAALKHLHETFPKPSAKRTDLSQDLERIVLRCVAREPVDRYEDGAALVAALASLSQPDAPAAPSPAAAPLAQGAPDDEESGPVDLEDVLSEFRKLPRPESMVTRRAADAAAGAAPAPAAARTSTPNAPSHEEEPATVRRAAPPAAQPPAPEPPAPPIAQAPEAPLHAPPVFQPPPDPPALTVISAPRPARLAPVPSNAAPVQAPSPAVSTAPANTPQPAPGLSAAAAPAQALPSAASQAPANAPQPASAAAASSPLPARPRGPRARTLALAIVPAVVVIAAALIAITRGRDAGSARPPQPRALALDATTDSSVTLTWSAPGGEGSRDLAVQYDLRWSRDPLGEDTWAHAQPVAGVEPAAEGAEPGTITVGDLAPETHYWFAIKAADSAGNWSALSNVVDVTTAVRPARPRTGTLVVRTNPPDARIVLAGRSVRGPTATLGGLAPGRHNIRVEADGYVTATRDLVLAPGQTTRLDFDLRAIDGQGARPAGSGGSGPGALRVFSGKHSLEVILDGKNIHKTTPCVIGNLAPGEHSVFLKRSGYEVKGGPRDVRIAPGDTVEVNFSGRVFSKGEKN